MALWAKTKTQSKTGFDKVYGWVDKLGAPVNRLSNKVGSEAFWPTTLDIESDKAARILKSFCKDGYYEEEDRPAVAGIPQGKQKVLKKIPTKVIQNAKGLCIFTTMRSGLWISGSGGAGILVARTQDGSWSPPSGIMMHTVGVGFLAGVDIYDCVIVINNETALEAFQNIRCTLGGEISATAGPAGIGGMLDTEIHKRQSPLFTYIKSRGFYAGLQLDGTIIIERTDENERFYGQRIGVKDILAGKVNHPPYEIRRLMATLKSAQGDTDVDESLIPDEAPPADFEITGPEDKTFGIPDAVDPDPYGVLALQEAGLEIREAGTHSRPTSEQFEFKPSPTSPIYNTFRNSTFRRSIDRSSYAGSQRSSWRVSTISSMLDPQTPATPRTPTVDMSTQTDDLPPPPTVKKAPPTLPARTSVARMPTPPIAEVPETRVEAATPPRKQTSEKQVQEATPTSGEVKTISPATTPSTGSPRISIAQEIHHESDSESDEEGDDEDDGDDDEEEIEEEPVVHEIHQAPAPQAIRARVIQVAKPVAPALPVRNPFRNRMSTNSDGSLNTSAAPSPTVAKHSPDSIPSLMRGDSTSSLSSVEDSRLEQISNRLKPKTSHDQSPPNEKEEKNNVHALPESPMRSIPGGFE
ncbi:Ysc84 domain containing protein [Pyrenophora teres f. maculata]|nr:Ysc84 domain containing protein [Pyrenophora teres f. maculata]